MNSNFDKTPYVEVAPKSGDVCASGWDNVCDRINDRLTGLEKQRKIVVIDCYQGILNDEVERALQQGVGVDYFFKCSEAFKSTDDITAMVYPDVTDDRIFGRMTQLTIDQFFDEEKLRVLRQDIADKQGTLLIYGEAASFVAQTWDVLVYLDMARWEIQQRMRRDEVGNLGLTNCTAAFAHQYKQAYFVDWRVLDKHKIKTMSEWDFLIDTNEPMNPKIITGGMLRRGLASVVNRPFRVVPFFDPGPWGGQWLKELADLDRSAVNYAWAFDCVPEENSLLLRFGDLIVETPAINVVFAHPEALLGDYVYHEFGAEFPIRFDFLDTMDGGNLSLQVHPSKAYIKQHFGMNYTQDESYYLMDAKPDASVYLGFREGINATEMIANLESAHQEGTDFDADRYVCKWQAKKHDHFLIPAGTIHCSGKDSVVLEISATPYIFTFKLWDWGRVGLDGKPRPINIERGKEVMQWDRTEDWVARNLVNQQTKIGEGDGWIEERTGLHETQFIETRRHWFTKKVSHHTRGGVNVINLVAGDSIIVESPTGKFLPFVVHYAETFIVPAEVGAYTIRPSSFDGHPCATLKAYVRATNSNDSKYGDA